MSDDLYRPMKRKTKRKMSNRESGRYEPNEPAAHWWKRRLGIGNKAGEGTMARDRKKAQNRKIDEAS